MTSAFADIRDELQRIRRAIGKGIPLSIVLIDELEREVERALKKVQPRDVVTKFIDQDNVRVLGVRDVISVKGRGWLKELTIKAEPKDFSIIMLADGSKRLNRTFEELRAISEYLEFVDAFDVEGEHVVRIKDIKWASDFLLTISTSEEVVFKKIFGIWDEELS